MENNKCGYIYIRTNEYWDWKNTCKLGQTLSIPDRNSTYITSEITKGQFIIVIKIKSKILKQTETNLIRHFKMCGYHSYLDGGTEFFTKDIINMVKPFFIKNDIEHKVLTNNEIDELIRNTKNQHENCEELKTLIPYQYQNIIIDKSFEYFQQHDKGLLIIPCGVGKTLISLWISNKLKAKSIVIGVPNLLLLYQWRKTIMQLFDDYKCFIICSGIDGDDIYNFMKKCISEQQSFIIITTYASSYKLINVNKQINKKISRNNVFRFNAGSDIFKFDVKINDECHHLTSTNIDFNNETKKYINMLKIESHRQLSLTATTKDFYEKITTEQKDKIISNDSIEHFGNVIERKCLLWAIQKEIVCDYLIQTIVTNRKKLNKIANEYNEYDNEFDINDVDDKRLFLSAFASLKSIECNKTNHILIYSNNTENSKKIIEFIEFFIDNNYFNLQHKVYYNAYHGSMNKKQQQKILHDFENNKYGIISCVYCLGEGYDFPMLDGVVFSENMTSNIRIVQSALRACRKYSLNNGKISKIIIPMLNSDKNCHWLDNNEPDYKKIRNIINELGQEDKTISEKIVVCKINLDKSYDKSGKTTHKTQNNDDEIININENEFDKYDIELIKELKLCTISRISLQTTYSKAVKIIKNHLPKIINKNDYYKLCDQDVRLTKQPEEMYENEFKNWIYYLSIDTDDFYDLKECKKQIKKYIILHPEIQEMHLDLYTVACKLSENNKQFPPNDLWTDYYSVEDNTVKTLADIIDVKAKKKKIKGL